MKDYQLLMAGFILCFLLHQSGYMLKSFIKNKNLYL